MEPPAPYRPDLSLGNLFARSWPLFKENLGLLVGSFIVYALLVGMGSSITGDEGGSSVDLLGLVTFVITGPLTAGLYAMMLRVHRHEPIAFTDLFEGFREFGRAFGVYALSSLAIIVGLILLVVPGIILAVGLWPALFLVMEDDLGVVDTLKEAWAMTDGYRLQLFGLGVALFFFFLAGVLAFVVGLFFTGAFSVLVAAAAYEELSLAEV
jgi:uncharacterized membrane protein